MTPEQRERVRMILQSDADHFRRVAEAREDDDPDAHRKSVARVEAVTLACELLTPEAEADRRLGAKVREAIAEIVKVTKPETMFNAWAAQAEATNRPRPATLYRAIAAALREEGGRR